MSSKTAKQLLEANRLAPKSSFGQNFLEDRNLVTRLAELCAPEGASVLELGAGLGALTRPLLERVLREADAKGIDVAEELGAFPAPRVLCGNLPYNITGPLIEKAVHAAELLSRVVFLVQLEVADRLAAKAGEEDYGALSVFVQAAYHVERALVIRRGAFYPQPRVDSAVEAPGRVTSTA